MYTDSEIVLRCDAARNELRVSSNGSWLTIFQIEGMTVVPLRIYEASTIIGMRVA
jgi:hypothetical protein